MKEGKRKENKNKCCCYASKTGKSGKESKLLQKKIKKVKNESEKMGVRNFVFKNKSFCWSHSKVLLNYSSIFVFCSFFVKSWKIQEITLWTFYSGLRFRKIIIHPTVSEGPMLRFTRGPQTANSSASTGYPKSEIM